MNMRLKVIVGTMLALAAMFAFVWFQGPVTTVPPPPPDQTSSREKPTVSFGNAAVTIDIADSQDERARGLSGRTHLGEAEGMLFVFDEDERHSFWMKDMLISIDMIWLSKDKRVVHIVSNATPQSYPTSYAPDDNARYVLEVPAGWAARHGVVVGSTASF